MLERNICPSLDLRQYSRWTYTIHTWHVIQSQCWYFDFNTLHFDWQPYDKENVCVIWYAEKIHLSNIILLNEITNLLTAYHTTVQWQQQKPIMRLVLMFHRAYAQVLGCASITSTYQSLAINIIGENFYKCQMKTLHRNVKCNKRTLLVGHPNADI